MGVCIIYSCMEVYDVKLSIAWAVYIVIHPFHFETYLKNPVSGT